jgi:hypothetical protein
MQHAPLRLEAQFSAAAGKQEGKKLPIESMIQSIEHLSIAVGALYACSESDACAQPCFKQQLEPNPHEIQRALTTLSD